VSTGRFRAIDRLRRRARFDAAVAAIAAELRAEVGLDPSWDREHSIRGSVARRAPGAAGRGATRRLSGVQRRVLGVVRRGADAARRLRRGDPLQAAIAAVHAEAQSADDTDWPQIVGLYDLLVRAEPSPVIELNRAVAIAMRDGPEAALPLVERILGRGDLAEYQPAHAARADLCRRVGRTADARAAYERALELTQQEPERRFLQARLHELGGR
jgi:predicted RNA polymerase sigma factor